MRRRTKVLIAITSTAAAGALFAAAFVTSPAYTRVTLGRSPVFDVADDKAQTRDGQVVATSTDRGNIFAGSSSRVIKVYTMNGDPVSILNDFKIAFDEHEAVFSTDAYVTADDGDKRYRAEVSQSPPRRARNETLRPGWTFVTVSTTQRSI